MFSLLHYFLVMEAWPLEFCFSASSSVKWVHPASGLHGFVLGIKQGHEADRTMGSLTCDCLSSPTLGVWTLEVEMLSFIKVTLGHHP